MFDPSCWTVFWRCYKACCHSACLSLPSPRALHFVILKFSLLAFLILLKLKKKKVKESEFSRAADIYPKVIVCHKIISLKPIGRKYCEL